MHPSRLLLALFCLIALTFVSCARQQVSRQTNPSGHSIGSGALGRLLSLPLDLDIQELVQSPPRDTLSELDRLNLLPATHGPALRLGHVQYNGNALVLLVSISTNGNKATLHGVNATAGLASQTMLLGEYHAMEVCTIRSHTRIDSIGNIRRLDQWVSGPNLRLNAENLLLWAWVKGAWQPQPLPAGTPHAGIYRSTDPQGPDGEVALLRLELWEQKPGVWKVAVETCREEEGSISQCVGMGNLEAFPGAVDSVYLVVDDAGQPTGKLTHAKAPDGMQQFILEASSSHPSAGSTRTFQRRSECE
jgi:hypothetical protein